MAFVYLLICIAFSLFSHNYFKKWVNPITAFCLPWGLMLFCYNLKFVEYYNLDVETYLVVLIGTVVFFMSCLIGANLHPLTLVITKYGHNQVDMSIVEKKLKLWIIILSSAAVGVSILRLIGLVGQYGWDFYNQLAKIYGEKLLGIYSNSAFEIPYSGFLIVTAVTLAGIYFSNYGFKKILLIPLIVLLAQPILGGTKQVIIEGAILIAFSVLLSKHRNFKINKLFLIMSTLLIVSMIFFVTSQRINYISEWSVQTYATPGFQAVIDEVPALYQIYTYFSSPVGVLNAYLMNPNYSFGGNTLLPLYNLLGHFDPDLAGVRFQEFYSIPIHVNVGTMFRELIQDYHYIGAASFLAVYGGISGNLYRRYLVLEDMSSIFLNSMFLMATFMSFFIWMFRDANLLIALFVGNWICSRIQR
jgi:oligosaccharide repeat unit polymerase